MKTIKTQKNFNQYSKFLHKKIKKVFGDDIERTSLTDKKYHNEYMYILRVDCKNRTSFYYEFPNIKVFCKLNLKKHVKRN